ncbi:MAG: hypothetical protein CMI54_01425 [Parcubacteria group bacterium]|nr:hypothetical protein [Parcubacteria group bacterium]|tara:strand:- start:2448 stop:2639 length:192 start_codon:yes stop_codon:yes gene_type:complete
MSISTIKQIIEDIKGSGAKYVKTSVSNEACAVSIAINDIECLDELPNDFWWRECSVGLDVEDY